jgi:hypothetical protein
LKCQGEKIETLSRKGEESKLLPGTLCSSGGDPRIFRAKQPKKLHNHKNSTHRSTPSSQSVRSAQNAGQGEQRRKFLLGPGAISRLEGEG